MQTHIKNKLKCFGIETMSCDKEKIISLFIANVKGKKYGKSEKSHCGDEGQWLEKCMGIRPNCKNIPDINGFEQKKESNVITFIDKQTDEKYYKGLTFTSKQTKLKEKYWRAFERTNSKPMKIGGWKLNKWDHNGQCLKVDRLNNINIMYSYSEDKRDDKDERVSKYYRNKEEHIIGVWKCDTLQKAIEKKFNVEGFYMLKKNKKGEYDKICFGQKITFELWIEQFKQEKIYYDGYSSLNGRWRGCFRAKKHWWNDLITEEYS